jgi:hypothetical protein
MLIGLGLFGGLCAAIAVSLRYSVGHFPPSLASIIQEHRLFGYVTIIYLLGLAAFALVNMERIYGSNVIGDVVVMAFVVPFLGVFIWHDLGVYRLLRNNA